MTTQQVIAKSATVAAIALLGLVSAACAGAQSIEAEADAPESPGLSSRDEVVSFVGQCNSEDDKNFFLDGAGGSHKYVLGEWIISDRWVTIDSSATSVQPAHKSEENVGSTLVLESGSDRFVISDWDRPAIERALASYEEITIGVSDRYAESAFVTTDDGGVAFIGNCQQFDLSLRFASFLRTVNESGYVEDPKGLSGVELMNLVMTSDDDSLVRRALMGRLLVEEVTPWSDREPLARSLDPSEAPEEVVAGLRLLPVVFDVRALSLPKSEAPAAQELSSLVSVCIWSSEGWLSPCTGGSVLAASTSGLVRADAFVLPGTELILYVGDIGEPRSEFVKVGTVGEPSVSDRDPLSNDVLWVEIKGELKVHSDLVGEAELISADAAIRRANEILPENLQVDQSGQLVESEPVAE